jgi:type IV pilus assembly protein PilV
MTISAINGEMSMNMMRTRILQTGSVLLEAMIAILIFSIGILALVGMQATAIATVSDAKYRSTAGFLANQVVGTMWATRLASASAAASGVTISGPNPTFACTTINTCKASANPDVQTWATRVSTELPKPTSSITIAGSTVTIQLGWTPPGAAAGAPPHRYVVKSVFN